MTSRHTIVGLAGALAVLGLAGCGAQTSSPPPTKVVAATVQRKMVIYTGKEIHKPGWPKYDPAFWSAPQNSTVTLTIVSHDSGAAPLMMTQDDKVSGTIGGVESIDGKAQSAVDNQDVAHTFTIPAMGLNLPIPVAPAGQTVTVVAQVRMPAAGSYSWQCMAPCGTGPMGMGGPMVTPGYMQGTITVTPH